MLLNRRSVRTDRHCATRRLRALSEVSVARLPWMHPHKLRHTFVTLVFGNATALAIDAVPESAGTASAIPGTLQSGLGAPLVGLGGQHTAIPLYLAMTVCSVAALPCGSYLVGAKPKRPQPARDADHLIRQR
ncbi:multidrug effflux MFS transporter [Amycolatopsis orientalis]|nr:multidrug effflux MFS transporter [Amycolatopsis orientalis]